MPITKYRAADSKLGTAATIIADYLISLHYAGVGVFDSREMLTGALELIALVVDVTVADDLNPEHTKIAISIAVPEVNNESTVRN